MELCLQFFCSICIDCSRFNVKFGFSVNFTIWEVRIRDRSIHVVNYHSLFSLLFKDLFSVVRIYWNLLFIILFILEKLNSGVSEPLKFINKFILLSLRLWHTTIKIFVRFKLVTIIRYLHILDIDYYSRLFWWIAGWPRLNRLVYLLVTHFVLKFVLVSVF